MRVGSEEAKVELRRAHFSPSVAVGLAGWPERVYFEAFVAGFGDSIPFGEPAALISTYLEASRNPNVLLPHGATPCAASRQALKEGLAFSVLAIGALVSGTCRGSADPHAYLILVANRRLQAALEVGTLEPEFRDDSPLGELPLAAQLATLQLTEAIYHYLTGRTELWQECLRHSTEAFLEAWRAWRARGGPITSAMPLRHLLATLTQFQTIAAARQVARAVVLKPHLLNDHFVGTETGGAGSGSTAAGNSNLRRRNAGRLLPTEPMPLVAHGTFPNASASTAAAAYRCSASANDNNHTTTAAATETAALFDSTASVHRPAPAAEFGLASSAAANSAAVSLALERQSRNDDSLLSTTSTSSSSYFAASAASAASIAASASIATSASMAGSADSAAAGGGGYVAQSSLGGGLSFSFGAAAGGSANSDNKGRPQSVLATALAVSPLAAVAKQLSTTTSEETLAADVSSPLGIRSALNFISLVAGRHFPTPPAKGQAAAPGLKPWPLQAASAEHARQLTDWCVENALRQSDRAGMLLVMHVLRVRDILLTLLTPYPCDTGAEAIAEGFNAVMPLLRRCPGILAFFPAVPWAFAAYARCVSLEPRACRYFADVWLVCRENSNNTLPSLEGDPQGPPDGVAAMAARLAAKWADALSAQTAAKRAQSAPKQDTFGAREGPFSRAGSVCAGGRSERTTNVSAGGQMEIDWSSGDLKTS